MWSKKFATNCLGLWFKSNCRQLDEICSTVQKVLSTLIFFFLTHLDIDVYYVIIVLFSQYKNILDLQILLFQKKTKTCLYVKRVKKVALHNLPRFRQKGQ